MRKKLKAVLSIVTLCIMTACGTQAPEGDIYMTQMSESETADENMTQVSESESTNENTDTDKNMTQVLQNGAAIQEDGSKVYFLGKNCIYTVDKTSNQTQFLWKSDSYEPGYNVFDGCGIILGEKLYFLEDAVCEDVDGTYTAAVLSVINTDGSGYVQAVLCPDSEERYSFSSIYYSNDILYAYNGMTAGCLQICADGTPAGEVSNSATDFWYMQDREDYSLLYYDGSTGGCLSPVESMDRYGFVLMRKDEAFVKIDVETGSEEWINFPAPVCMIDDKALFIGRESDIWSLESFDINTKERKVIGEIQGTGTLYTAYGNDTLYYMICDDAKNAAVGYISVADGTGGILFELQDTSGYTDDFSPVCFGLQVSGNALYYMDMKNYDAYLMKNSLDTLQQEPLGEPIYSTGINKVGRLEKINDKFYSEQDAGILVGTTAFSWLVVNADFAGAEKINAYLYEEMDKQRTGFENTVKEDAEFLAENGMQYSYDSSIKDVKYFDGSYLSFIQEDYEYLGGAHGLPIWNGYVFDLATGERLLLPDIISNTEEELKGIVTRYFGEKIDAAPDDFWADAKDTVYEYTTLDTVDFALVEDGIHFYFHPYSLAAYAGGFQEVTIPYSEFALRLDLAGGK